jgi:hypothetical protein
MLVVFILKRARNDLRKIKNDTAAGLAVNNTFRY